MTSGKIKASKRSGLRRHPLLFSALVLIVAGFLAYSNSFNCSFHWDDVPAIVDNDDVHHGKAFAVLSNWADINFRPLPMFTFFLNWQLGGAQVWHFHLVNLMIHILTAFLVFVLVRHTIRLLDGDGRYEQRLKDMTALFVALLFLLHPVQTMAVTYIVQRMTLMAALFYILAIWIYALGREAYLLNGNMRRSVVLLTLAMVSGVMAVMSKQNAITFPAAFILYEIFFIRKTNGKACRRYILSASAFMLSILLVAASLVGLPAETDHYTRVEYFIAQLGVLPEYLLLILFPAGHNADPYLELPSPLIGVWEIIGILLLAGMLTLAFVLFKRNRLLSFGILFFFLGLSVESGIFPIKDIMMEHRLYLPMFGAGIAIAGLILRHVPYRSFTLLFFLMAVYLVILAYATHERNKVWASEVSLWTDCLEKNPENSRAMYNLGLSYKMRSSWMQGTMQRREDLAQALKYFSSAAKTEKYNSQARVERSLIYLEMEEYDLALNEIKHGVLMKPSSEYVKPYIEGVILAKQGRYRESLLLFDESVSKKDDFALSRMWRGLVRTELKMYREALDDLLRSVELSPGNTVLYVNISNLYYYLHDRENAIRWIRKAEQAGQPVDPAYLRALGQ